MGMRSLLKVSDGVATAGSVSFLPPQPDSASDNTTIEADKRAIWRILKLKRLVPPKFACARSAKANEGGWYRSCGRYSNMLAFGRGCSWDGGNAGLDRLHRGG